MLTPASKGLQLLHRRHATTDMWGLSLLRHPPSLLEGDVWGSGCVFGRGSLGWPHDPSTTMPPGLQVRQLRMAALPEVGGTHPAMRLVWRHVSSTSGVAHQARNQEPVNLPRCCLNQYSGKPKRRYDDWETADYEAARLNIDKDTTQYNSYNCSNCGFIHIGRSPKVIKFSHIASDRETAAMAAELGPRVVHGLLSENRNAPEEEVIAALKNQWRRAIPPTPPVYPKRVLP